MINSSTQEKINNILLSLLVVLGVYTFCGYFFDFFYDLNDDMVIKNILAGVYTGVPDGHTNQMLYPIGWFLGCFYNLLPKVPVFGIFLCICFGMCFGMISYRIQSFFKNTKVKVVTTVLLIGVFASLMLWELVYVQYSVVCGVLAGTACFLFYTSPIDHTVGEFWRKNLVVLLLVWLAFLIRSEMLLLTTPFIVVAGIWHWSEATESEKEKDVAIGNIKMWKYVFSKKNIGKYIGFVVALLVGLGVFAGADYFAYRSQQWKEYRSFFDARTDVYDYTWYPNYEEQQAFYEEQGISKIQYQLIDNYNFGLDETITENTLEIIAAYGEKPKMLGDWSYRIRNSMVEPLKRLFSLQDMPYSCFVLVGYGLTIGLAVVQKDRKYFGKLLLLFAMRWIPWFYLTFVQRAVDRITHPLYIIEFLLLLALVIKELYDRPLWNVEKYYRMAVAGVLMTVAIAMLPFTFMQVKTEQERREQLLQEQKLWDDYAKTNPDNYYYMDVYSTVSFMEKMFEDVDNSQKNYDLLGGWVCHSPLQEEARKAYIELNSEKEDIPGQSSASQTENVSIAEALLLDNFYFVAESICDVTFIEEYYVSEGKEVMLELEDIVGEGENPFLVYKVMEK